MSRNSKAYVLVARTASCSDSQRTSPSRQTHETDIPDTTVHDRELILRTLYHRSHLSISRNLALLFLRMASVRIAHMSRDEVMERLEQLGWEPAANVAYTVFEKKSILHELEEKATKSEMNDIPNVCAGLSQKNKTS